MITRLTGILERVQGNEAVVASPSGEVARQVLIPSYLSDRLAPRLGEAITLHTLEYLESPNQGASFIPRLVGFATEGDRRFFELLTTVKGIGNRKALRALSEEPASIARAIIAKDARALTALPEIGKRMAETMIVELTGKVDVFLAEGEAAGLEVKSGSSEPATGVEEDAVEALMALGETRGDATAKVSKAAGRLKREGRSLSGVEDVLGVVFGGG